MEELREVGHNMTETMKTALLELTDHPQQLETWIKLGGKNIRLLNAALKKGQLNMGLKKNLESNIGKMSGYRVMMKALHRQGAGYVPAKQLRSHRIKWEDVQSAFNSRVRTGVIINLKHVDPLTFLEDAFHLFSIRIKNALKEHAMLKVNVDFCGEFVKNSGDTDIYDLKHFNTRNEVIERSTDMNEWWEEHVQDDLIVQLEDFQEHGSGWILSAVINLAVNINRYVPLRGSSYVELPPQIAVKQAVINLKTDDHACFAWAVMAALYPAKTHSDRISSYPHYSTVLNLNGIQFPMAMSQIKKFEKQNNVSINVYELAPTRDSFRVDPVRLTKEKLLRHVNLLLIQNSYGPGVEKIKFHYCYIKNLSRLITKQQSKYNGRIRVCERCLQYFFNDKKFMLHEVDCKQVNECRVTMPWREDEKVVKFRKVENKTPVKFIIYGDLESMLKPMRRRIGQKTEIYQKHEAFSVGYYFKCFYDDSLSYYRSYRGQDCMNWFAKELKQIAEDVEPVHWAPQPMTITPRQEQEFQEATHCHICNRTFEPNERKVRDHDHMTSDYRGAAHVLCNLNFKESKIIPIVFHNLSSFDAHFILRDIMQEIEGPISLLPINKEKYISFTKSIKGSEIKFRFIDSLRFMPYSLDKLASFLNELKIMRKEYSNLSEDKFRLITRKGVFPYDYVSSIEKLEETRLPNRKAFENKLTSVENPTRQEENDDQLTRNYEHAHRVWEEFGCTTLGEYSDLYLKTDVLLLADVFENFRETCFKNYGLDPAHYVSAPGLTWDAMLKYTNVELELIPHVDILMFVERGIRGGISQCSNRYAKANNKYMHDYDPLRPSVYLQYYDINNLYGWAMSQYLPYGGFRWSNKFDLDVCKIPDDSPIGYMLEVDLEYPNDLHDVHKDLPFCPQHGISPGSKQKKLITTLYGKQRYVLHYRALKQVLKHGLKLTKIHRILEFNQSDWMKSYIAHNTSMRTKSKNEFEKTFYKLMNNACFGKTIEDVRKRKIIKMVSKWDGRFSAKILIARPNFHSRTILDENLVIIELNKTEVTMNKPVYVGMSVLDISKTKLYEFHYDYMLPKFGPMCKVLYGDTDSLLYEIKCDDIYEEIKTEINRFDTSDYAIDNPYGIPLVNKKVLGLMKDENNGRIMTEFVGLRSKMYSVRVEDKDAMKKVKGVKAYVVKQTISFNDYLDCLQNSCEIARNQNCITSKEHVVYSVKQNKIAISYRDDKRCLLPNTTDTLPWGHYSLYNR